MPKKKKPGKFLVQGFGPAELLKADIAEFLRECEGPPPTLAEYRDAANWLASLVVHPEWMAGDAYFAGFYAAHPRFTLEFMVAMRRAFAGRSKGETWLRSFDAMARQHMKDDAILPTIGEARTSNVLRTAREKLRRQSLQQKRKVL